MAYLNQVFASLYESVNLSEDAALIQYPSYRREFVVQLGSLQEVVLKLKQK